jgi:phosphonate metabolism protein (transferase hexapeptide repeat family)
MKKLGIEPLIDPTAKLEACDLAEYTEIGPGNALEHVRMDRFSYTCQNCYIQHAHIGAFANIAAHVRIGPTDHPMHRATLHHFTYRRQQYGFAPQDDIPFFEARQKRITTLGPDCWIGHGAIILPDITIGTGAVIGAGAIVTKSVPDYAIVVGTPAKVIRYRFSEETMQALNTIAWWHWSWEKLRDTLEDFSLPIEAFIEKHLPN